MNGVGFGGPVMNYLRELNLVSILFRIFLSVLIGGFLGMERGKRIVRRGFGLTFWCVSDRRW